MATAKEQLKALARTAILSAQGDTEKALAGLDDLITAKNRVDLERELCSAYRTIAMRALLATHFHELRAEGRIAMPAPAYADEDDAEDAKPSSWAKERVKQIEARKANYLNDFRVNGEPIGDCTPEVVLEQAERRERDARFMRMMANGVPPGHKIREFVTEEEAANYWERSQEEPKGEKLLFSYTDNPRWIRLWRWITKGIKNADELALAQDRVVVLLAIDPSTHADDIELDGLARAIKEYEDARQ